MCLIYTPVVSENCAGGGSGMSNTLSPIEPPSSSATTGFGCAGIMMNLTNISGVPQAVLSYGTVMTAGTWEVQVYYTTTADTYVGNENNGTGRCD